MRFAADAANDATAPSSSDRSASVMVNPDDGPEEANPPPAAGEGCAEVAVGNLLPREELRHASSGIEQIPRFE